MKIFISYRRADSPNISGRIYDRLVSDFGAENIFKDVDNIPLGVDFEVYLNDQIIACDAVIAVIGRQWLSIADEAGDRRIMQAADFVRMEIDSALKNNIPVVPVFVNGVTTLDSNLLPPSLLALPKQNGIPVRPDPDFHKDMERLITGLRYYTVPEKRSASDVPVEIENIQSVSQPAPKNTPWFLKIFENPSRNKYLGVSAFIIGFMLSVNYGTRFSFLNYTTLGGVLLSGVLFCILALAYYWQSSQRQKYRDYLFVMIMFWGVAYAGSMVADILFVSTPPYGWFGTAQVGLLEFFFVAAVAGWGILWGQQRFAEKYIS